jgi:hypothetical protein
MTTSSHSAALPGTADEVFFYSLLLTPFSSDLKPLHDAELTIT